MNYTAEQIKKAKQAKSVEELLAMAQAENYEMTAEEAQKIFAELHKQGELSDDELTAVAGGKGETAVQHPKPKYAAGESHWLKTKETWATIVAVWWSDVDGQWIYHIEIAAKWDPRVLDPGSSEKLTLTNKPLVSYKNEYDLTRMIG